MRYSLRAPSFLIAAVVVFTLTPTISVLPTIGQEVKPTTQERFSGAQQAAATFNKLLAKLDEPTTLDFFETPLADVAQEVSDLHHVLIHLEHSALKELGMDASESITSEIENVKLGTALSLLLDDLGLVLSARDNVFLFTTADAERKITRVYETSGLVHADDNCEGLIQSVKCVEPESWSENGGEGTVVVYERNLVVSQYFRTHVGIVALLNELRDNIAKAGGPKSPKLVPAAIPPTAGSAPRRHGQPDVNAGLGSAVKGSEGFFQLLSVEAARASEEAKKDAGWHIVVKQETESPRPIDLKQRVTLDLNSVPLKNALSAIGKECGVDFQIDRQALEDLAIDVSEPVSVNVRNLSLETALQLMLRPLNLCAAEADGYMEVTTEESHQSLLLTKLYDIRFLLEKPEDEDRLIDVLTASVQPSVWEDLGGYSTMHGYQGVLVVSSTYEIHKETADLIKNLGDILHREVAKED